ncbi:MAG: hypothetical protein QY332_16795 [Anaerolineales bacterium]|nr:MAG: hypothetical protein QY332_16795 [Anaerolineales bacterium]
MLRFRKSHLLVILIILLLGFSTPVLADYLGPDRTVTTAVEECKVVLWECMYVAARGDYRYHRVDDWSCSNESKPWQAYANYPGDCESWNDGRTQWGQEYSVRYTTLTHPEATITGTLQNCTLQNGWCVTAPQLELTANEPLSGHQILLIEGARNTEIFACPEFQTSCQVPLLEGENNFEYWALSSWGDSSRMGSLSAQVDTISPDIDLQINGSSGTNGWHTTRTSLTAAATDATSGLASFEVSADGGAWTAYSAPLSFTDGVYRYQFKAVDNAGNINETPVLALKVDSIPPAIALTDELDLGEPFNYSLQDDGSGLYLVRIVIEDEKERFPKVVWEERVTGNKFKEEFIWDGRWKDGSSAPVGEYLITVKAGDAAGNESIRSGIVTVNPLSYFQPIPAFTPPLSQGEGLEGSAGGEGNSEPSVGGGVASSTSTQSLSFAGHAGAGAVAAAASTNVLWGAMAAAVIGYATALALEQQKKRKDEEAAQIAQVRAEVEARNAAIEANRIAMREQWKIRSWLEGQAILKAQLEYLQDQKASPDEIEELQKTAATQGFGAAIANAITLGQQLAAQQQAEQAKQDALQDFLSKERDTSAAEAWQAQQQAQEQQAGLMAYYLGRKAGEEGAQSQADKPWWEKTKDWVEDKVKQFVLHPPSWLSVSFQPGKPFSLGNSTIDEWVSYQPWARNILQSVVFQRMSIGINESLKLTSNPAGYLDINFSNGRFTLKGEERPDGSRVDYFIQPFALSFGQTISTSTDRPDIRGVNVSTIDMDILGKNWATIKVSQATGRVISPMPVTLSTGETIATSTTTLLKTEVSIHRWPRLLLAAGVLIFAWEAGGFAALGKLIPAIPALERVFN